MGLETIAVGAVLAGGIGSAISSVSAGNAQAKNAQRMGEYNAQIYEQQAQMIQNQKRLQEYQFNRNAARQRGAIAARTGGNGLMLSGSPLAVLVDNESQMQLDHAVNNYNSDIQSNYATSEAAASRYQGSQQAKLAKSSGYSNAFSSILNTGTNLFQIGAL